MDSEFHCQIADFGLTQYVESAISRSFVLTSINYTAPELFEACSAGCGEQTKMKTMEADVYAFGCLHYAVSCFTYLAHVAVTGADIFRYRAFSREKNVSNYVAPRERRTPKPSGQSKNGWWYMESHRALLVKWSFSTSVHGAGCDDLFDSLPVVTCWSHNRGMRFWAINHQCIAANDYQLKEPVLNGSTISEKSLRLMLQVLDLPEYDTIASELRTTSEVELLLEFVLHVCIRSIQLISLYLTLLSSCSETVVWEVQIPTMQIRRPGCWCSN